MSIMGSCSFYIILGSLTSGMMSSVSWCIDGATARGWIVRGMGKLHAS